MEKKDFNLFKAEDIIGAKAIYKKTFDVRREVSTYIKEIYSHTTWYGRNVYKKVEADRVYCRLHCNNYQDDNSMNFGKYDTRMLESEWNRLGYSGIDGNFKRKGNETFLYPCAVFYLTEGRFVNKYFENDYQMEEFIVYVNKRTGDKLVAF